MRPVRHWLAHSLCAGAIWLPSGPQSDRISFRPRPGSEFTRRLEVGLDLGLDDLRAVTVSANGERSFDLPGDAQGKHLLVDMLVATRDAYVDVRGGRPVELLRTFDDLNLEGTWSDSDFRVDRFAELEGQVVRFRWAEDRQAHALSLARSRRDPSELTYASEDMDLRALLPLAEVAEGDTWRAPPEVLLALLLPGGLVGKPWKGLTAYDENRLAEEASDQLRELAKGVQITCTYEGIREEDGIEGQAVRVQVEGSRKLELPALTARIWEALCEGSPWCPRRGDLSASYRLSLESQGRVCWDPATGCPRSYQLETKVKIEIDVRSPVGPKDARRLEDWLIRAHVGGVVCSRMTTQKR